MKKAWPVILLALFLATFFGLIALRYLPRTDTTSVSAGATCDGCGIDEASQRFGVGRIPGEQVTLPDSVRGGPVIVITVTESCDYCAVPVATVALALDQLDHSVCPAATAPSLYILGPREVDVAVSQALANKLDPLTIHAVAEVRTDAWRTVLATDIAPTTLVLDADAKVVAEWIGFDPGHGTDLVAAVHQAAGCVVARPEPLRSALSALAPGDLVPTWVLAEAGVLDSLPTTLVFSDDNCSLCIQIRDSVTQRLSELERRSVGAVYVDASPSREHLVARQDHFRALADTPFGADLAEAFPDVLSDLPVEAGISDATEDLGGIAVHLDSSRHIVTALVGGTVPSAVIIGSDGAIQHRLIYRLGETPEDYLFRLASAAVTTQ